jgi:hypothetical protein
MAAERKTPPPITAPRGRSSEGMFLTFLKKLDILSYEIVFAARKGGG